MLLVTDLDCMMFTGFLDTEGMYLLQDTDEFGVKEVSGTEVQRMVLYGQVIHNVRKFGTILYAEGVFAGSKCIPLWKRDACIFSHGGILHMYSSGIYYPIPTGGFDFQGIDLTDDRYFILKYTDIHVEGNTFHYYADLKFNYKGVLEVKIVEWHNEKAYDFKGYSCNKENFMRMISML